MAASNIKRCRWNSGRSSSEISAAAEIIGGYEELVVEILQRLPSKSLIPCKSVSKTWLSFISSRRFSLLLCQWRLQQQHPKISGLFFNCSRYATEVRYTPTTDNIDSSENNKSLALFPDFSNGESGDWHTKIIDSCNGYLLFRSTLGYTCRCIYNVYNPTTKQFSTLPWPTSHTYDFLYLAFDPLKSLHYKLVFLQRLLQHEEAVDYLYQIYIYSSETNAWWSPFPDPGRELNFSVKGVYCNGSIHWISYHWDEAWLYFDVHNERLCPMPSPPKPFAGHLLLSECRGHLHLLQHSRFNVIVYEMESDYSKWSLKYRVNLTAMIDFVSKEMIVRNEVSVCTLIDGQDEGDVFLVLFVGTNMIISYNIKDNTFKKLHDLAKDPAYSSPYPLRCLVNPYIETLFPV